MPHKRNPILSERLCGLARVLRGYLSAGLEDVALWHERDISHSSVERVVLPDASMLTLYMLQKARGLVEGLVIHPERALATLTEGSHGLVFSQSRPAGPGQRRPEPGRRLPHRAARRPGGVGRATGRSARSSTRTPRSPCRPRRSTRPSTSPAPCAMSTDSPTPWRSSPHDHLVDP